MAAAGALVLVLAVGWVAFELALAGALATSAQGADRRLALFDRTLEAIIERFHFLPATIALAPETRALLAAPDGGTREAANAYLSRLNDTAGVGELFIMSMDGAVLAASNWWAYDSLVGHDFAHRPYFADALDEGDARFYAVGVATGVAGYFLSQRIDGPDGPIGVAVAKVSLGEIEANWWRSGELIAILDDNDIAILSTRPDWRYRPLLPMDDGRRSRIAQQERYGRGGVGAQSIAADLWPTRGTRFAFLAGDDPDASGLFVYDEMRLPTHGWRLAAFTPTVPLFRDAWIAALAAALGTGALLLLVVLVVQRRRRLQDRLADHEQLERRVAERTEDLAIANEALRAEITERIGAERARQQAQLDLAQAARLASLGQALAGVAHEVSQPVAALTTHLASAKLLAAREANSDIAPILSTMDKVVDRLAALTGHLKTFARKQPAAEARADLATVIANALDLVDHRLRAAGIDVEYQRPGMAIVSANAVHLEQVVINLLANAADAMAEMPVRILSIGTRLTGTQAEVTITDTGTGIAPADLGKLFDPFFSTKAPGHGLGLGLSISYGLVRDMGGTIAVQSRPGHGAAFTLTLPLLHQPVPA